MVRSFRKILVASVPILLLAFQSHRPYSLQFSKDPLKHSMVKIQGGSFIMGDVHGEYDEITTHKVTLSTFLLSETEVTQAQWVAVMGKNPSYDQSDLNQPVTDVNWFDCQEFIKKLNLLTGKKYRLPTEAEWEYAARGGKNSHNFIYAGSDNADSVAWNSEFENEKPHVVGKKSPNELGLYDMSGNVWEWCNDWYALYNDNDQVNPTGPVKGESKVIRGGSWGSSAEYCRATLRFRRQPQNKTYYYGLRLAESLK